MTLLHLMTMDARVCLLEDVRLS